jgi:hypothetical protein
MSSELEGQPIYTDDRYTLLMFQALGGSILRYGRAQMVETFISCL